jgi:hypothetical protein
LVETKSAQRRLTCETAARAVSNRRNKQVAGYRLYGLDGVSKVSSGLWFEADDDDAAVAAAKETMDGHDCELWAGKRLVARLPGEHKRED